MKALLTYFSALILTSVLFSQSQVRAKDEQIAHWRVVSEKIAAFDVITRRTTAQNPSQLKFVLKTIRDLPPGTECVHRKSTNPSFDAFPSLKWGTNLSSNCSKYSPQSAQQIGYKQDWFLQNLNNEKRKVKIPNRKIVIQIDETSKEGTHLSRLNSVECIVDSVSRDSVYVSLISEEIDEEFRNRFSNTNINYFTGKFTKVQKSILKDDILYLNMKNHFRQTISQVGSVVMASAIILIVASPFVGLQLKGNARTEARERVFSAGTSCFVVSLPLFIIGKNKKYILSPEYKTRKSNYWKFQ